MSWFFSLFCLSVSRYEYQLFIHSFIEKATDNFAPFVCVCSNFRYFISISVSVTLVRNYFCVSVLVVSPWIHYRYQPMSDSESDSGSDFNSSIQIEPKGKNWKRKNRISHELLIAVDAYVCMYSMYVCTYVPLCIYECCCFVSRIFLGSGVSMTDWDCFFVVCITGCVSCILIILGPF